MRNSFPSLRHLPALAALVVLAPATSLAVLPFDVVVKTGDNVSFLEAHGSQRVSMTGGHVSFFNLFDSAYGEISGGDISHMEVRDSAQARVVGGEFSHIRVYDSAFLDLAGATSEHVTAEDGGRIDVSGGVFRYLTAMNDTFNNPTAPPSIVNMRGGMIETLTAYDRGVVNLYGGHVQKVNPWSNGFMNVYGGTFPLAALYYDSVTNVYGRDFHLAFIRSYRDFEFAPLVTVYQWTGTLRDGTPLNAELRVDDTAVLNLFVVPEPPAVTMLAVALLTPLTIRPWRREGKN